MIRCGSARESKLRARESFCRVAANVSSMIIVSKRDDASCARRHAGHILNAGKSQPPHEMAIPFKRCSL
jgi:hypothetical protein